MSKKRSEELAKTSALCSPYCTKGPNSIPREKLREQIASESASRKTYPAIAKVSDHEVVNRSFDYKCVNPKCKDLKASNDHPSVLVASHEKD